VLVSGVLLVLGAYYWLDPAQYRIFPICLLHHYTGLQCPGCGGQRAVHQLLHGDLLAAWHQNALLVLALPVVLWLGLRQAALRWAGWQWPVVFNRPGWWWIFAVLTVGYGLVRNLPQTGG
jgi:hypothetical protein